MDAPELLLDGPAGREPVIVLAHGAGAPMDSPWLTDVARGLAASGWRVVRFEFPYMRRRRTEGSRRPPDPGPVLERAWLETIERLDGASHLVIGGKSLGGRIASVVADRAGALGLCCLGYPFHPPGRPDRLRTRHLETLRTPTLIVQGSRDALGSREEIAGYPVSPAVRIEFVEDGDHSFRPRKASGRTAEQNLRDAIAAVDRFVRGL